MSEGSTRSDDSPQPGFASIQDSSERSRRIQRRVMRVAFAALHTARQGREVLRRLRGGPHVVDFFHQVDDAYSELALQAVAELRERYDVVFRFHLVGQADKLFAPEPEMLAEYARRDCAMIAPHYGLSFPKGANRPNAELVGRVEALLTLLRSDSRFIEVGLEAGRALWAGDVEALDKLSERVPSADAATVREALEAGSRTRAKRRHYSGAMFSYAGEWFWGVDRLHHLERRLIELGASYAGKKKAIRFDRPPLDAGENQNDARLRLEMFPSLRSPYTAMIFDRTVGLAESVDIPLELSPVMPMVMRGVPAPGAKGIYIMTDTLREAKHIGAPFGNMHDPIGSPVLRGFSLWPYARDQGRGAQYLSSFLSAAFAEGRSTGTDEGLRFVVERAGLDWQEAAPFLDREEWRDELEANRQTMYEELGAWGVPSYRLSGSDGEPDLCVWGQDRLWLVASEIKRRLA